MDNRFHQLLYQEIAEPNLDKMRSIDADLDKTAAEFYASIDEAKRESPNLTSRIKTAQDLFDQVVSESRLLRGATTTSESAKALQLMRANAEPRLLLAREALIQLADELQARVDQQFVELTDRTDRTILITWIVIVLGLAASFVIALSIVQVEVVKVVLSFRGRILDVAQGRLDQPIANLDRPNEIGEMSRALETLQVAARERETLGWVKTEVAATTERLQTAEDFPEFAAILLSRISESFDLLYGAFYLADENHSRFTRVGAFATDVSSEPREFALGEGLVGQAAVERHAFRLSTPPTGHFMFPQVLGR